MTGKTHLLIGIGAGLLLIYLQPQTDNVMIAAMVGAAAVGALLPDVDSPESTINRWIPPLRLLTLFFKHRGALHSLFIPFVANLLFWAFLPAQYLTIALALTTGYISHLVADGMTLRGVPLLYPFNRQNLHLLPSPFRLVTGGVVEWLLSIGLVIGMSYYVYQLL